MNQRRIAKSTLDTQFAAVLRDEILSGKLTPGQRLTEMQLADDSNLSRGTVRAALRLLVAEGLVVQAPYAGWEVIQLSADDVWELFTLRSALEGLGARLAALCRTKISVTRLEAARQDLIAACDGGNRSEIVAADFALHRKIIELSGHSRLAQQYDAIGRQVSMAIAMSDALVLEPLEIARQHEKMIAAILKGQAERAEREARRHNEEEGARLVATLREREAAA